MGIQHSAPTGDPSVLDGRGPWWRGQNYFRVTTFVYAVGIFLWQWEEFLRPSLGLTVLVLMGVWTVFSVWRYSRPEGRTNRLVLTDQVVVTILFLSSEFILTETQMSVDKAPTVVTLWHSTMITAAGIQWGVLGGGISGVVASICDWALRGYIDSGMTHDFVLLIGVGILLGLSAETASNSSKRLARALRAEAATRERERLARSIHDSVLQVLARVRRRGRELGGEAAELAELAGDQEIALRALVTTDPAETDEGETDLVGELQLLRSRKVQVSVPGTPVTLPSAMAEELIAFVREALGNVDRHAGPDASAWVFLEDLGSDIVLSVRDDGPGITEGRLAEAEAEGRMGVAHSIRRRIENFGGTVTLETAPGEGVEWEGRVSRPRSGKRPEGVRGGK